MCRLARITLAICGFDAKLLALSQFDSSRIILSAWPIEDIKKFKMVER